MNNLPNGSAYMLAQDTIARLTKENADLSAQLAAANADPNDIEIVSPPPVDAKHYTMIPYAEHLENKSMRQELADAKRMIADARQLIARLTSELEDARKLVSDHCEDEEKVREILKEFDKSDSYGSDGSIVLAERAAEALTQARAQLADAQRAAENSKADANMYHDAWLRELGGKLIPKTHRIDALVLTTQLLVKDRDVLAAEVRRLWKGAKLSGHYFSDALDRAGGGA